ncbi:unnamed protein product [Zymoseptoria tritici ST99CH_1E4]|uniref:MULE transposase domain-containing protein n=1 Tax=Zymoseptoria tritici ST99CH_1E4 TaxID=1276532 RepID=A0A2H1G4K0_ZYMTR|nr:unnamed protein product [Zymoseptoria tritici ST99CH_1E4]
MDDIGDSSMVNLPSPSDFYRDHGLQRTAQDDYLDDLLGKDLLNDPLSTSVLMGPPPSAPPALRDHGNRVSDAINLAPQQAIYKGNKTSKVPVPDVVTVPWPPPFPRAAWQPHPLLAREQRKRVESFVQAIDPSHYEHPRNGEVYKDAEHCYSRLQDYAFTMGFAVVCTLSTAQRKLYYCIHHGDGTRNDREFEEAMNDSDDEYRNLRARAAKCIRARHCKWYCRLAYKRVRQDAEVKRWILTIYHLSHCHEVAPLPTVYTVHQERLPNYHEGLALAAQLRLTGESYKTAYRQLSAKDLQLNRKKYYNLTNGVTKKGSGDSETVINALLGVLVELGFCYEARWSYEHKPWTGIALRASLEQVVYWMPRQEVFARRFLPDFCMQVDATFNIERGNLLLGVISGVANTGRGFPVAYSLMKSESAESWHFMLTVVAHNHLKGVRVPKVIVSNRGKGLTAAIPDTPFSAVIQQYCQWHAAANITERINLGAKRGATAAAAAAKARLRAIATAATDSQAGHAGPANTTESSTQAAEVPEAAETAPPQASERKPGYTREEKETLTGLVWPWLKSETVEGADEIAEQMLALSTVDDKIYFQSMWLDVKERLLTCYVKHLPNLGASSTQRAEVGNRGVKGYTNPTFNLKQCVEGIAVYINKVFDELEPLEFNTLAGAPLQAVAADNQGYFAELAGEATAWLVERLLESWYTALEIKRNVDRMNLGRSEDNKVPYPIQFESLQLPERINAVDRVKAAFMRMLAFTEGAHESDGSHFADDVEAFMASRLPAAQFRANVASLPQARPFEAPRNEYNVRKARKGNNNASSRLQTSAEMTATATQQAERTAAQTQEAMLAAEQRAREPEASVAVATATATATTRGGRAGRARGGGRGGIGTAPVGGEGVAATNLGEESAPAPIETAPASSTPPVTSRGRPIRRPRKTVYISSAATSTRP